jgi:hypothetical protein
VQCFRSSVVVVALFCWCVGSSPSLSRGEDVKPLGNDQVRKEEAPAQKQYELRALDVGPNFICMRFDRVTGQTWTYTDLAWSRVPEDSPLPAGDYDITLVKRGNDFRAFRIDRRTGATWGIAKGRWARVKEPD